MPFLAFVAATPIVLSAAERTTNSPTGTWGIDDSKESRTETFGRATQGASRRTGFEKICCTPGIDSRVSLAFSDNLAIETLPFAPKLASTSIVVLTALQNLRSGVEVRTAPPLSVLGIVE
jgi:hypothetical protein